jgi:type I restriction enzyme S subunit
MSRWLKSTIGELCDLGRGEVKTGPFGSQLHQSDYQDTGTPVVMPADIVNGKISKSRIARVSQNHVDRLHKHKLLKGDIIYGRRGDIGRQALVRSENIGWLCGTGCLRVNLGNAPVIPEFLHFYLNVPEIIGWIQNQAIGATMPNLNTNILRRVQIRYPKSKNEQRKIASVVFAYDDLIENNKRRITQLEKMAEEIYREWFVRMRFPGHEKVKFEKKVPEGWEIKPYSDVVDINPFEKLFDDDYRPYIGMENLSTTSMYFSYKENRKGKSGSKFRNDDVLFPRITPCLENGKRGYVMTLEQNEVGLGSTEFIVMRRKELSPEHIYFITCSDQFRKHAEISMAGASGRQRVQENCFSLFLVKVPPKELRLKFRKIISPFFSKIRLLNIKIITLSQTRDLLLSRLISGKLRVEALDIQYPPNIQTEQETVHA